MADCIRRKHGIEVLFIPMQEARDLPVSRKTLDMMQERGYLLEGHPTPSQLLGVVGGAQFILGMRLHTLIYAAKMGTPVIGLTYDPKVEATMRYIGQEFTEPVEHVNPITICRYVDRIVAEHDTLTAALKSVGQESENKAIENTQLALELLDRA